MTRIALLSDIHGNSFSLEAVLQQLAAEPVDSIVCLGDVALFGPQPQVALRHIQALNCSVVMGNTDAWALDPVPYPYRNEETEMVNAIDGWSAQQLDDADRDFIRTFQPVVKIPLGEDQELLCYHGAPRSFHERITALTPESELESYLAGTKATLLAGGHTHEALVRRYHNRLIINPGSVGQPVEFSPNGASVRNPPWAEYAILTWEDGAANIELRRLSYDTKPLMALAETAGMPFVEWWLRGWKEGVSTD